MTIFTATAGKDLALIVICSIAAATLANWPAVWMVLQEWSW